MVDDNKQWKLLFTKRATKDAKKLGKSNLKQKTESLLNLLEQDPFCLPYKKLIGDFDGYCSRRINIQHRLVYKIIPEKKEVIIISMWTHYHD